jgi:hypothetical protein
VLTPESQCRNFINNPFQYQTCLNTAPTGAGDQSNVGIIPGATVFQSAPQRMVNGQTSFNITPRWAAQWSTSYDVERKEFGLHQVSLQRELHDWRAVFAFTQSPTGAFAFNFYIALNAQPDIKFDYNRRSFRQRRGSQDFNSF